MVTGSQSVCEGPSYATISSLQLSTWNKLNNWDFYFKLSNRNPENDMNFQLVGANQLVHWFLGGKGLGTQE